MDCELRHGWIAASRPSIDLPSTRKKMIMTVQARDKLMSLTDVSEMLGIPVQTLYRPTRARLAGLFGGAVRRRKARPLIARRLAAVIPDCGPMSFPDDGHLSIIGLHAKAMLSSLG